MKLVLGCFLDRENETSLNDRGGIEMSSTVLSIYVNAPTSLHFDFFCILFTHVVFLVFH